MPIKRLRAAFERLLEAISMALMAALAIIVVLAVIFRKAGASLVWYDEVAGILLAWLTFYGAALAALKRAHIGFPKLVEAMSPRGRRAALLAREAIVVGFMLLVAWAGWRVLGVLGGTYLVTLPAVSARVSQSAVLIGAVCFALAELLSAAEQVAMGAVLDQEDAP